MENTQKSLSEPPRRSERIKQKGKARIDVTTATVANRITAAVATTSKADPMVEAGPDANVPTSVRSGHNAKIPVSTRSVSNSTTTKLRITEIEHAIEQKELQFRKERELLDLQQALELAQIEGASEKRSKVSSICESEKPNVETWLNGEIPWDRYNKSNFNSHLNNHDQMSHLTINQKDVLPQLSQLLVRQSLPRDLPYFEGNPIDWPNFIHQYRNTNALCNFTNEENQARLQKCLKGQAKRITQSLLIMPQNVEKVIELLQSRFGKPEHIILMLVAKLKQFTNLRVDQVDQLIEFTDEIKNFVATVQSLGEEEHLHNPMLLWELLNKLPTSYKVSWAEHLLKTEPKFKLLEFANWLDKKANILCQIHTPKLFENEKGDTKGNKRANLKAGAKNVKFAATLTTQNNESVKSYVCCCQPSVHHLTACPKFSSLSVNDKWTFVKSNKLCFSCLMPFHIVAQCNKKRKCGIDNCIRPHNKILHKKLSSLNPVTVVSGKSLLSSQSDSNETNPSLNSVTVVPEESISSSNKKPDSNETNCHIADNKYTLLKILPVVLKHADVRVETFALLDDASTITLIDKGLSEELRLSGPSQPLHIQWTNDDIVQEDRDSKVVSLTIQGINQGKSFQLRHVRTMNLALPTQTVDIDEIRNKYPYIGNHVSSMKRAQPKIIIGQDNWPLLTNKRVITGPWNGPALSKTLLGWAIHGNLGTPNTQQHYTCYTYLDTNTFHKDDLDLLHDLVKESWRVDEVPGGKNKSVSPEDRRAEAILQATMKRVGTRYETGLLWKHMDVVLPESKDTALKRLLCTERKMDKDAEYAQTYCEKFLDQEKKGYIRKLTSEEAAVHTARTWYLPHFGTANPNKPTKLRIVFDAAAKSHGVSLNDHLLTGPDLYNSLLYILLNFRIKKYAFTADIREMFLQVRIRPEDCHAQRLLWRGMDRHREPDVYEINVVFFGSSCGPCLAQEAKNRNALEFKESHPEAVSDIVELHYMDDYLGGADSIPEGIKLVQDVIHVHKQGGFAICGWTSNSREILHCLNSELVSENCKNLKLSDTTVCEKILGIFWDPNTDTFQFHTKFHKVDNDILTLKRRPTKREILKIVMSVFDPLGFLANFLIQGKVLLQDIWRIQIGWDNEIPDSLNGIWLQWVKDLHQICNFRIPRQYFTLNRNDSQIQLHTFCDASEKCYAAVAYLRVQKGNNVESSFVCAKTRVAPLKPMSIPRLELQAALMAARLGGLLKESLRLNIQELYFWSDSKTVLHWIHSEARRFKVFVSQRVGEIQELTNPSEWRYIPSKLNIADDATKRKEGFTFDKHSSWIRGPKFLRLTIKDWPKEQIFPENVDAALEVRAAEPILVITPRRDLNHTLPEPSRFSKWWRLVRATAYTRRFIKILREKRKIVGELEVNEIEEAEVTLFQRVQHDLFKRELSLLHNNKPLPSSSKLFTLSPILANDGLLRLGGRLENSSLGGDTIKPIILDTPHNITQLLIQHYHEQCQHFGQEIVVNNIRQKFWIFRVRQVVKKLKRQCQYCLVKRGKPNTPLMGQLPKCRVEPTIRPFVRTGVDYFGPLDVKVGRKREKRYGAIFTCMATRAIHLEIAHDLTTNEFINVLRQFGCRRGFPREIYCDNGTNFKGADKELKGEFDKMNQIEIVNFCTLKKTRFNFNPALAPNMGGSWERLIRSVKTILREILKTKCPTESVLRTFLLECENILNSRPLTHISMDVEDMEALTPNHFLIGPEYAATMCATTVERDLNLMSSWRAAQKLTDHFWQRWTKEYVPTLVKRSKWFTDQDPVQVGDPVILIDPGGPRNSWPKGIVEATYPAKDGKIRMVDIRNEHGAVWRRPVSKIIPLVNKE